MGRIFLYASAVASVLLLTLIYALVAVQGGASPSATATPSASAGASPPASAAASAGAPIGMIMISAFDIGFDPKTVDVPTPGVYTVMFDNTGAIAHNLTFADGTALAAEPGKTTNGTVTIPAGGTTFSCTVIGHAAAGMTGSVTVAGATAGRRAATATAGRRRAPTSRPTRAPRRMCSATRPHHRS